MQSLANIASNRRLGWLILSGGLLLLAAGDAFAQATPIAMHDNPMQAMGADRIRLLGALDLAPLSAKDADIAELSGLGWDTDEQVLYAVSDRGKLLHLRPTLSAGRLLDVTLIAKFALLDKAGKPLIPKA